jgi:thiamine pyrophosphokinase
MVLPTPTSSWNVDFLQSHASTSNRALIILNRPFSATLLHRLWNTSAWRCCADGGANRLYDIFDQPDFVTRGSSRIQ